MKKITILITMLIISLPLFCNNLDLVGNTWELTFMEDVDASNNQLVQNFGDIDGDGIEEVMSMDMYMTFDGSKTRVYMMLSITGTETVLEDMGLEPAFTYTEIDYILSGNTISVQGDSSEFEIVDNILTISPKEEDAMTFKANNSIDLSIAVDPTKEEM